MPEPDAGEVRARLEDTARAAGDVALGFFQADPRVWDKGGDAGPVTEADLAADALLRERLLEAFPGFGWLSEESEDNPDRLAQRHVFIVDPIDGTRSFIEGSRTWAVSAAYAVDGEVVAAVVHLPARELTYTAARGGGVTKNGAPVTVSQAQSIQEADILSAKVNFRPERWDTPPPVPKISFRSSLAYRMALVAEGRFDAMVTLRRTWEWDVAAGALLVSEAGGALITTQGGPARFNTPSAALPGLIAGAPALVGDFAHHGPRLPTAT